MSEVLDRLRLIEERSQIHRRLGRHIGQIAEALEQSGEDVRYLLELVRETSRDLDVSGLRSTVHAQEVPPAPPAYQRMPIDPLPAADTRILPPQIRILEPIDEEAPNLGAALREISRLLEVLAERT